MAVHSTGRGTDAVLGRFGWTLRAAVGALELALITISSPMADDRVILTPPTAAADSDVTLSFSVAAACVAGPPASIAIDMPEGVIEVRPHASRGWRLTVEEGALRYVYPHRGAIVSSAVRRALWSRDDDVEPVETRVGVGLRLTDFPLGEKVAFAVTTTCRDSGSGEGVAVRATPTLTIAAPPRRRY